MRDEYEKMEGVKRRKNNRKEKLREERAIGEVNVEASGEESAMFLNGQRNGFTSCFVY